MQRCDRFTPGITERNLSVAHFLVSQYCRTRGFRDTYCQMVQDVSDAVANKHEFARQYLASQGRDGGPRMSPVTIPKDQAPLEHAAFMFLSGFSGQVMSIMMNQIWCLGINDSAEPLLTSDSPGCALPPYPGNFARRHWVRL